MQPDLIDAYLGTLAAFCYFAVPLLVICWLAERCGGVVAGRSIDCWMEATPPVWREWYGE